MDLNPLIELKAAAAIGGALGLIGAWLGYFYGYVKGHDAGVDRMNERPGPAWD